MEHEERTYLEPMLDVAVRANEKASCQSDEGWESNEDLRLAVIHLVQTLGEAARKVSAACQASHPEIPWREAIGMRNVIVHDDLGVDDRIV